MSPHVTDLYVYPIKSCAGIQVPELKFDRFGPLWDRRWVIVDENNKFVSQRAHPKMALIQTKLDVDAGNLDVTVGGQTVALPMEPSTHWDKVAVTVWNDEIENYLLPKEYGELLSEFLGISVQLTQFDPSTPRQRNKKIPFQMGFADSYPVLVTAEASLKRLNQTLETPIPMNRFRPNIVIKGYNAYEEDKWEAANSKLKIGSVDFVSAIQCERCQMINNDQKTGVKDGNAVLKSLINRGKTSPSISEPGTHPVFGSRILQHPESNGKIITLGDLVSVTA